jgi:hypothetical protein
MRFLVYLVLFLSVSSFAPVHAGAQQRTYEGHWDSYVNGTRYESVVTTQDLIPTPRWEESQPAPPLTARAALVAARECLQGLELPIRQWDLDSICLRPAGDEGFWYYQVVFAEHRDKPGLVRTFTITVLMNGVAVVPKPRL